MLSRNLFFFCLAGLTLLLSSLLILPPAAAGDKEPPVRIGMVQTLFTDVPSPLVQIILQPFGALMKEFTGMDGKMVLGGDPLSLGKDLDDGKVDLAVFHGVEFAWAQNKYPKLRPLMVAITKYKHAQAQLVVRKDMDSSRFGDLKGKPVSLPMRSREHCRLFLARNCNECGQCNPQTFFSQVVPTVNVERALDDLCLGKVDGVVVDTVALENYQDIKPGCRARLKVLKDSELFPTGVIAYREGSLNETICNRFREGLGNANKTDRGRDMMSMFRITGFETIPDDYAQNLTNILKAYPPPESPSPVSAPR